MVPFEYRLYDSISSQRENHQLWKEGPSSKLAVLGKRLVGSLDKMDEFY